MANPEPLAEWVDREIFRAHGRLYVEWEDRDGLELNGRFESDQWDMLTVWRFEVTMNGYSVLMWPPCKLLIQYYAKSRICTSKYTIY